MRQIGLALCLMASLLIGHASACDCSHHDAAAAAEADCHSDHGSPEMTETSEAGGAFDEDCICSVEQPALFIAAKSSLKKLVPNEVAADSVRIADNLTFVAVATVKGTPPQFANGLSYSTTLKSLLPARAPPRL